MGVDELRHFGGTKVAYSRRERGRYRIGNTSGGCKVLQGNATEGLQSRSAAKS